MADDYVLTLVNSECGVLHEYQGPASCTHTVKVLFAGVGNQITHSQVF